MIQRYILMGVLALAAPAAEIRNFTGVITDAMCLANHKMMKITPDSKCVKECVKGGSKYVLQDGKTVYRLSDQAAPAAYAGQRVTVRGTLFAKTGVLKVQGIRPVSAGAGAPAKR